MGDALFLSEYKKDGLKNNFYCLFLAYQNMMNHTKVINSNIPAPSDIESDTKLRDPELEINPELESHLNSNHMGTDSSFDASTSDYTNLRLEPYVEEFPWLYYNVLEKGIQV